VARTETWEPGEAETETPARRQPPPKVAPEPRYPNLAEFVDQFLAPMIRRRIGGSRTWCPEWWRHPEAVDRLHALWHAWETLRLQGGTAMSDWWIHHFDPHYMVLADLERGPFQACGHGHKELLKPLPNDPLPPDWRKAWDAAERAARAAARAAAERAAEFEAWAAEEKAAAREAAAQQKSAERAVAAGQKAAERAAEAEQRAAARAAAADQKAAERAAAAKRPEAGTAGGPASAG
jgi:hypothetical protein